MGTANAVLLGAILGGMMCTDMGGPVNKAYAFGGGSAEYANLRAEMAAIMAAGMWVPPLALGRRPSVARRKFDKEKRNGKAVKAAFGAGAVLAGRYLRLRHATRCVCCRAVSLAARVDRGHSMAVGAN